MTVQEHIVNDMKSAMREKNVKMRDFLRVVMAEFSREGKELTDEQANAVLTKMVKSAKIMKNDAEVTMLELYLPSQMEEAELREKIQNCITFNGYTTMQDMGKVMGYLNANHKGLYDGKLASTIVKELLA